MKREYWVQDFGLSGEVLDPEYYDEAIVGVSFDGKAIYDWNKIIELTIINENMTEEDAVDWHEYNTLRSVGYLENPPVFAFLKKY